MKNGKKTLLFSVILVIFLGVLPIAKAETCTSSQQCADLIKKYTDQISSLQGQAKTLKNQIAQFDAQIQLTTLKISQTEEQIRLLGGRIDQLGISLASLTEAFSSRAVETYKLSRFENNFVFILSASDINSAFARLHYLEKIQEEDRNLLQKLKEAQVTYQGQKTEQETLQNQLRAQKANLNNQKMAKNNLLKTTQNDEAKYQSLLSQAQAQLNAFRSFVSSKGGASILSNQTVCDSWGCYYNQRDSSWGNSGIGLSSVSMADAGCLVTSVAMIAKHYGKNITPLDIASHADPFYSNTAYMNYPSWSISGMVGVTRSSSSPSEALVDEEVNAGRPVIVGLYGTYSYPQHFIVIKGKDGGGYVIYDPFMSDGGQGVKHLSDGGYSFSDIRRVDKVSIN
jgi:peptidoglycan hydrolase CwlO-like protein